MDLKINVAVKKSMHADSNLISRGVSGCVSLGTGSNGLHLRLGLHVQVKLKRMNVVSVKFNRLYALINSQFYHHHHNEPFKVEVYRGYYLEYHTS